MCHRIFSSTGATGTNPYAGLTVTIKNNGSQNITIKPGDVITLSL